MTSGKAKLSREDAAADDLTDPLAPFRAEFVISDPDLIYLDGNSLGRLPLATPAFMEQVLRQGWGEGLVRSWNTWIEWSRQLGDRLARHVLGARPGEVVLSDSTSVNLYKLAAAAIDAAPSRRTIVYDSEDFPTNRYLLHGLAKERGLEVRALSSHLDQGLTLEQLKEALTGDVALLVVSLVSYRSGALLDMRAVNQLARDAGVRVLWDLSHAAGAVPISLTDSGAELAVGCTYKYLNGGPGAPAFLYVRSELQSQLQQPLWGWFGQRDQFQMGPTYDPVSNIDRFLVGTPPLLSLAAVGPALDIVERAGVDRIREKGRRLGEWMVALHEEWLAPLGFLLASPKNPEHRGLHLSLEHPDARRICRALIDRSGVIGDFRTPNRLRLGAAPLYTRYVDVWDALDRLRDLVSTRAHESVELAGASERVT